MSIDINRYIKVITTAINAGSTKRELILRLFTKNVLLPTKTIIEFSSPESVGAYFGLGSTEYSMALYYFSYVSKTAKKPRKISFARWNDVAVGSQIYGKSAVYAVSSFTGITAGDFTMSLGGFTLGVTGVNLSGATTLADVASLLQTAIRAKTAGGSAWTSATVTYNATLQRFVLISGSTGVDLISLVEGGTGLLAALGWGVGVILSNGNSSQTVTDVLVLTNQLSDNFGSFHFMDNASLTNTQHVEIAQWNFSKNVKYAYLVETTAANSSALSALLQGIGGTAMTLKSPALNEYHAIIPAAFAAATDYNAPNSVINYMFNPYPNSSISVFNDLDADLYDGLKINWYGDTNNGRIAFYQRGIMCGGNTDLLDMNTYYNEMWLKSNLTTDLLDYLVGVTKLSANLQGANAIKSQVLQSAQAALNNGAIIRGKQLTQSQRAIVNQIANDDLAYITLQNEGFIVTSRVDMFNSPTNRVEYKIVYTLYYLKDDQIRKIEGSHIAV